jgi:hypothetical protein
MICDEGAVLFSVPYTNSFENIINEFLKDEIFKKTKYKPQFLLDLVI